MSNPTPQPMEQVRPLIRKYGIVALAVMGAHNGECTEENCEKLLSNLRQVRNKMLRKSSENKEE